MSLPPLPEPLRAMDWQHAMYTAEQMREYARAAVAAERARLDWVLGEMRTTDIYNMTGVLPVDTFDGVREAIDAIRARGDA